MSLVGLSAVALHIICVKCHKLNTNQVLTVLIRKVLDLPRGCSKRISSSTGKFTGRPCNEHKRSGLNVQGAEILKLKLENQTAGGSAPRCFAAFASCKSATLTQFPARPHISPSSMYITESPKDQSIACWWISRRVRTVRILFMESLTCAVSRWHAKQEPGPPSWIKMRWWWWTEQDRSLCQHVHCRLSCA